MMHIRISKYNPVFRNSQGDYLKNEWTSCGDIDNSYYGEKFKCEDYLSVENKYVEVIKNILLLFKVDYLTVDGFELYDNNDNPVSCLDISNLEILRLELVRESLKKSTESMLKSTLNKFPIRNGQKIAIDSIDYVLKLCLREMFWVRLIAEDDTYVHFGYDYYVYLGTNKTFVDKKFSIPQGIFIENCSSPYL